MNLIGNQMMQLEEVRAANGYAVFKRFTRTAIIENRLGIISKACGLNRTEYGLVTCTVEYRRSDMQSSYIRNRHAILVEVVTSFTQACFNRRVAILNLLTEDLNGHTQMGFENLTDVHSRRHAQRVQHDINRRTIRQERHIFLTHNAGNDTLVTMTTCHLIADRNLTFLCDVDTHQTVYARRQFIVVFTGENLNVNDLTLFTMRYTQGSVADFAGLFTEDGTQQAFFSGEFRFAFRRNLTDEDIARTYIGTNANDTFFVQILQGFFRHIRDIAGDFLWAKLRVAGIAFVFFNMNGRIEVAFYEVFGQQHGVLVVVAFPRHVGNNDVVTQCQFAVVRSRAVSDRLFFHHLIALVDDRNLIDTRSLVGTDEFLEFIMVKFAILRAYIDVISRYILNDTGTFSQYHNTGVAGCLVFHTGTDERCLRTEQRYSLTLHVRTHQGTVSIVVFEEWNHRRCNGEHLTRANVHVVNGFTGMQTGFLVVTSRYTRIYEPFVFVQRFVGLCDYEFILFISGEVTHFVRHAMGFLVHTAVRRFHKAELVHAGIGSQRTDKTDVRTFRRLYRAHTAVVRVVYVADFEACALTGQTARTKG